MTKLSDIQLILLTTASQRKGGNILPAPESISGAGTRLKKGLTGLLKRSLVSENKVAAADQVWREEDDRRIGLVITDAGRAVIDGGHAHPTAPKEPKKPEAAGARTKKDIVIELLKRKQGATLDELVEATGWLPHTTRAALTGLRKGGLKIDKPKRGEATCYRIADNS